VGTRRRPTSTPLGEALLERAADLSSVAASHPAKKKSCTGLRAAKLLARKRGKVSPADRRVDGVVVAQAGGGNGRLWAGSVVAKKQKTLIILERGATTPLPDTVTIRGTLARPREQRSGHQVGARQGQAAIYSKARQRRRRSTIALLAIEADDRSPERDRRVLPFPLRS